MTLITDAKDKWEKAVSVADAVVNHQVGFGVPPYCDEYAEGVLWADKQLRAALAERDALHEAYTIQLKAKEAAEGQLSIFTQAIGLMTTIKGTMVMRPDDPIGMAQEVAAYVADLCPRAERDAWKESAEQFSRDAGYYRGLVVQIGEVLGPAAYVSDDGTVQEDVLCAKVLELIGVALSRAEAAEGKACRAREQLNLACKWLVSWMPDVIQLESVMREINALPASAPCKHAIVSERLEHTKEIARIIGRVSLGEAFDDDDTSLFVEHAVAIACFLKGATDDRG